MSGKTATPPTAAQRLDDGKTNRVVKPGRQQGRREPTRGGEGRKSPSGKPGNKTPGNFSKRRPQQASLSSKHRWSSLDLTRASPKELSERVDKLQRLVENLQRKLNSKNSNGKSAVVTGSGRKDLPNLMGGRTMSAPLPLSSQPSTRNTAKLRPGPSARRARSVEAVQFAGVKKQRSPTSQAGKQKPAQSTVTAAKGSQRTGTAPQQVASPAGAPATPPVKARELPRYKGVSFAETVKAGAVEISSKPILKTELVEEHNGEIIPRRTKRSLRTDNQRWVDEELVHFLRMEFAFKPRTAETFQLMHTQLRKHLRTYDTSNYTQKQIYDLSVEVVAAAVPISPMEQGVRAGLKDEDALEELRKNNDFVVGGLVGRTGAIWKKKFAMPGKTK